MCHVIKDDPWKKLIKISDFQGHRLGLWFVSPSDASGRHRWWGALLREQLIKVQLPLQYEEMLCNILTQLHSRDPLFTAFAPKEYDWITSIYLKRYFWKLYSPWFLQQSAEEAVGILSGQRLRDVVAIGPLYMRKEQASDSKLLSRSWHVRVFPKKEERWMVNYNTSLLRLSSVSDVMLTDCIARKHEPLVNKNKNYISFFCGGY